MTVAVLVDGIQKSGIFLWAEGGKLKFRSPHTLSVELRNILKKYKSDILDLLSSQPIPYISKASELIVPADVNPKYKWWSGGQSIFATLLELKAPDSLIDRHIGELGSPKNWRRWQKIRTER